jgi:hypothetical protein
MTMTKEKFEVEVLDVASVLPWLDSNGFAGVIVQTDDRKHILLRGESVLRSFGGAPPRQRRSQPSSNGATFRCTHAKCKGKRTFSSAQGLATHRARMHRQYSQKPKSARERTRRKRAQRKPRR